jgi:hypothetical protein
MGVEYRAVRAYALWGALVLAALLCVGGCSEKAAKTPPKVPATATAGAPAAGSTARPPSASTPAASPSKTQAVGKPAAEPAFLSPSQVLAWKRGGTTSSLCDRLAVYDDGRVVATSCKGQEDVERGSLMLNEAQRNQLNEWLRSLKPLDRQEAEGASGSDVPGRLAVAGFGDREASASDIAALRGFATALFEQAVRMGLPAPTPSAPETGSTSEVTL